MIDSNRLRGRLARAFQSNISRPARRRFPFGTYRHVHSVLRCFQSDRFTDADPFKIVTIDPNRITDSVLESIPNHPQWGRVVGGEWDRRCRLFSERPVVRAITQHFEDGRPWKETQLYRAFHDQLDRFGNAWGYVSADGFESRCLEIERLYERIERDGYLSQAELHRTGVQATPVLDEVNVDVGRDGTLLWRSYGQHRLAIAKLLDVPEIPVLIHRRHRGWQAERDGIRYDERSPDLPAHPDLRDLVSG